MNILLPYITGLFLNMNYIVSPETRFLVPKNYRGNANEFYNSIISTYHCINVVINSSLYFSLEDNTFIQNSIYHSLSFFISDSIILLFEIMFVKMKKVNLVFIAHHFAALYFVVLINMDMVSPGKSFYYGAITYYTELPVIFLNYNKYLIKTNQKNTLTFNISNSLCKIFYFICRVINLPYITYITLPYSGLFERSLLAVLIFLNFTWFKILLSK